ncbi:hypothetical protein MRB53_041197 [Persea americana]|nr:hypothetical protein MRB53_041197 [Persea americana]
MTTVFSMLSWRLWRWKCKMAFGAWGSIDVVQTGISELCIDLEGTRLAASELIPCKVSDHVQSLNPESVYLQEPSHLLTTSAHDHHAVTMWGKSSSPRTISRNARTGNQCGPVAAKLGLVALTSTSLHHTSSSSSAQPPSRPQSSI